MKKILLLLAKFLGGFFLLVLILLALSYRPDISHEVLLPKYTDSYSHFVKVNGLEVHVKVKGEGEPIFLIHGSFSSLQTWEAWENELSQYFMTVSMDLPGHGLTGPDPKKAYGISDYAALLFQMADALGIDEFHVAGNSMGGGVALKMASDHPERILSLNLIDSSGAPMPVSSPEENQGTRSNSSGAMIFRVAQNPIFNKLLLKCTPKMLFKWNMKQVYFDPDKITDEQVTRYYEMMRREGNRRATVDRLTSRRPYQVDFDRLNMPVLIMWGAHDNWIPLSQGERLQQAIPGPTFKVFENAGHVPMEEIPTETVIEYLHFLGIQVDVDYLAPPKFFSYVP
ncbi:alpha/beta fold hydrolase [Cecembia calidifontis]|uniref:Pimeloyl-ACP methyl ester carboxylesterase n=1 Tax=Cecembia calidifontis TaxID=1187080 RepID=A0A4Q7PCT6_9BACT|nr:alpha/beta hydrolase [Cecembia calidifontis]RZS97410.1 pimeloyl-ACP methyl ester carboxylesterase [Cecembia calidifontis]